MTKPALVDGVAVVLDDLAVVIDLHQARRRDLVEHEPKGIDEKMPFVARHARGDVRVNEIVHAEMGDETITRGKGDARLALAGGSGLVAMCERGNLSHGASSDNGLARS